jgi:excinuclease ABC subunit A
VNGGEIVAEGTPEAVAGNERSFTGAYLRETLAKAPVRNEPITAPKRKSSRSSRAKSRGADADQPDLIAAK